MTQNILPLTRRRHARNAFGGVLAVLAFAWLVPPNVDAQSDAAVSAAVRACQRVAELSARLACYDRAFPPVVVIGDANAAAQPQAQPQPRQQAQAQAQPQARPLRRRDDDAPPTVLQIVEVETPSRDTTIFHSADGQVFVREDRRSTYTWPDTPFEVELETSLFGTSTYLKFPGRGPRIRVANPY